MIKIIKAIICWACIILPLAAFIRLVILGDQIFGTVGIVILNLTAIMVIMEKTKDEL